MTHTRRLTLTVLLGLVLVLPLYGEEARWENRPANLYRSTEGLTLPSAASPVAVVAQYLLSTGRDASTTRSIALLAQSPGRRGLAHARFEQRVNGRAVYGSYVRAAFDAEGRLVHLIENLADVRGARIAAASIDERAALRAALDAIHPSVPTPALVRRSGDVTIFARDAFFHAEPTVERVIVPMRDDSLRDGYLVTTWSDEKNLLHQTLVGGNGAVLDVVSRTNTDSYFVFPFDPGKGSQVLVTDPAEPVASPAGWLGAGAQSSIRIAGNNARAYLDSVPNNRPDRGGTAVTSGAFVSAFDPLAPPSDAVNTEVAVQNLFFLNNLLHDQLYAAGFVEAEGNFQEDNFGRGGLASDSVDAEAQDGGGTDNANFATPPDGTNPRMQMYLWTGKPSHQVLVGSATYAAAPAEFGRSLNGTGVTGPLGLAIPADACTPLASLTGQIAVIDRGACDFVVKVRNAQAAGAIGAIVANHAAGGDSTLVMGGRDGRIRIPSLFVGFSDGAAIKTAAGSAATIRETDPPPLQRDGDLDSDIVYHEYGHGLTWRMIGGMNGPLAGAIGEGMSDVLALIHGTDDRIAEYSASDPRGIRSAPYQNYPRTYGDVAGTGVHFDGEVYGAIGWRLRERYLSVGLTATDLLDDLVQGMRFTPSQPSFEQMRDGIIDGIAAAHPERECLVWRAFAEYGVGVGAAGTVSSSTVTVTESFALPAQCQ